MSISNLAISKMEQRIKELEAEIIRRMKSGFTVKCGEKSITIDKGVQAGKVWLEIEDGEGGDFPIEQVYKLLRDYYDKSF